MESLQEHVITHDEAERLVDASETYAHLTGSNPEELYRTINLTRAQRQRITEVANVNSESEKHINEGFQPSEQSLLSKILEISKDYPLLPDDKLAALVYEAQNANTEAANTIILSNLRLPIRSVRKYYFMHPNGRKFGFHDLYHESILAMNNAIRKFNPGQNKFSTYVVAAMERRLKTVLDNTSGLHKQQYILDRITKLRTLGSLPDDEILEITGWNVSQLAEVRMAESTYISNSLDEPFDSDNDHTFGESIHDGQDFTETVFESEDDNENRIAKKLFQILKADQVELIIKSTETTDLNDAEQRKLFRIRTLLKHPAINPILHALCGFEDYPEWQNDAACKKEAQDFVGDQKKKTNAEKKQLQETCRDCPVLDACEKIMDESRPEAGFWAGYARSKGRNSAGYNKDGSLKKIERRGEPQEEPMAA